MHPDLAIALQCIYEPSGLILQRLVKEKECQEYEAYSFQLNDFFIKFRIAKITPKKVGQFVVCWKRVGFGPIVPFDTTDQLDFLIISVRKDDQIGQFVFPKNLLIEQGIMSRGVQEGKRDIRVYPPWDRPDSRQAKKTQEWQLKYFFEIRLNENLYTNSRTFFIL